MFTGIITDIGEVIAVSGDAGRRMTLRTGLAVRDLAPGASVACAGVCLTVTESGEEGGKRLFSVDVSPETLSKTTIGKWKPGTRVNLEAALRVGDTLGGHFVTGHVDGLATLLESREAGEGN